MLDYTPCWKIDLDLDLATRCVKPLKSPKNPKNLKKEKNNGSKSKNRKSSCSG
jgi:hypothetical protein